MTSILGDELWVDPSDARHLVLRVSPECDQSTETVRTATNPTMSHACPDLIDTEQSQIGSC